MYLFQTDDVKEIALKIAAWNKENKKRSRLVIITQGDLPAVVAKGSHFKFCHTEYFYVQHSSLIFILLTCNILLAVKHVFSIRVENSVDPDQMASDS